VQARCAVLTSQQTAMLTICWFLSAGRRARPTQRCSRCWKGCNGVMSRNFEGNPMLSEQISTSAGFIGRRVGTPNPKVQPLLEESRKAKSLPSPAELGLNPKVGSLFRPPFSMPI